ncbi:multidrug resistance-associated protein 5-like protein, partial [Blyttiomyces helicus]
VEFKNVTLRYHRYGVAVLKSVSFNILPGEKIAIVGRSGSGKTTLLVSLLRIAEPAEGDIMIDGVDIGSIGLADLRSRIAIIPQEPVMLSGTIRSNLDPFGSVPDEELWKALRAVHLGEKIEEMPTKLDTPILENGKMFTLAERQLFCIARAIIIKTKVVVFDEPVVSTDNETDELIQSCLRDNFADCTVIILASRFRLIVKADRIMVMDSGRAVEFDTPLALLDDPRSRFSRMALQTG